MKTIKEITHYSSAEVLKHFSNFDNIRISSKYSQYGHGYNFDHAILMQRNSHRKSKSRKTDKKQLMLKGKEISRYTVVQEILVQPMIFEG